MLPVAHTTALYSAPQAKQYACNHHLNAAPLSELVCGRTQAGAYHTRSILHALALADNPRAPHASTSPSYRPYPPPEPHPQMAQRRLHTASSQLHHSSTQTAHGFITAQRRLHTASSRLNADCTRLHHGFITAQRRLHTASSRLHHSDQQYSTHCNAQPSHSKSRPTRMAWSPYHPPAYQGICCLRTLARPSPLWRYPSQS